MSRSRNGITIQINSEAALKNLIDADPEFELEIRKSVATNLAKAYERAVEKRYNHDELLEKLKLQFSRDINAAAAKMSEIAEEELYDIHGTGWHRSKVLKEEHSDRIKDMAKLWVDTAVKEVVDERSDAILAEMNARIDSIREDYDRQLDRIANDVAEMVKDDTVKREVDERVTRILAGVREELEQCGKNE